MAWEENSCISLNMQLIAILSRIGVVSALSEKYKAVNHCDWHSEGLEVYNRLNSKPFDDRFR